MSSTAPPERTRTISWADPREISGAVVDPGGLAFIEAWLRGEIPEPPMARLMNFRLSEAEKGRVVVVGTPGEYHYNPAGIVHGGLAATLIDSATGIAVMSVLPGGTRWTTLSLNVSYVRPMTEETGPVRCEGTVIHQGSRVITAEARIVDEGGKLYAHGSASCMVLG